MALQAKLIHLRTRQQVRICRAMRIMARKATLFLDGRVLKNKRPNRINVALGAHHGLPRRRMKLVRQKGAMRIVAIAANHQAFIYPVVFRHREIRLDAAMAPVAQPGLSRQKQVLCFEGVDRVAGRADDVIRHMRRPHEILMAFALLVARQTPFARLLWG